MPSACFFSSKVDKRGSKSDKSDTGVIHKVTLRLWEKLDLELDHQEKDRCPFMYMFTGHSKESTFLSYIGAQVNKDAYADAFMRVAATL